METLSDAKAAAHVSRVCAFIRCSYMQALGRRTEQDSALNVLNSQVPSMAWQQGR